MTRINDLGTKTTLAATDKVSRHSALNGDTRRTELSAVTAYIQANSDIPDGKPTVVTSSPTASPFTVTPPNTSDDLWLLITPDALGYTATIDLPAATGLRDGQKLWVTTDKTITTLNIGNLNGADAALGAPTSMNVGAYWFKLVYIAQRNTWYRIG